MTQASEPSVKITVLTGEMKLDPIVYRYVDNGDGTGWVETDYARFGGGPHADLLGLCRITGIEVTGVPSVLSSEPRGPCWRFWR